MILALLELFQNGIDVLPHAHDVFLHWYACEKNPASKCLEGIDRNPQGVTSIIVDISRHIYLILG